VRILHVTEAGGAGTFEVVRVLAARLARRGHEVAIAAGRRPASRPALDDGLDPAIELHELPWTRRTAGAQLAAGRAIRRLVADRRPDVVHLHSSFAGAVGAIALPRGVATVYTPHGMAAARVGDGPLRRLAQNAAERFVVRRAGVLGAVSHAEAELARRVHGARRVTVVPNGIPELDPGCEPGAPHRREPVVVAAGRIDPARRPAATARILAGVAGAARVAWVGGAPADEDRPLRAAGIPITGWLERERAIAEVAAATVYLHWSAWDGLSLGVLEALAHDVVVVASDIPANREIVGPEQVRASEPEAIELIRAVLADAALRERLLASQRERRAQWSAERMTDGWEAVYARVAPDAHAAFAPTAPARTIGVPWS
jgi:glycosyltransferase involved in cell wall biosynthesis